jgi:hypothetical protein
MGLLTCFDAKTGAIRCSERLGSGAEGFSSSPVSDGRNLRIPFSFGQCADGVVDRPRPAEALPKRLNSRVATACSGRPRLPVSTPGSVFDFARQDNSEGRAVPGPGLILEQPAVPFDDASGHRQAKASAGFLGAEERVEKALLDFGRDALAVVGYFWRFGLATGLPARLTKRRLKGQDEAPPHLRLRN